MTRYLIDVYKIDIPENGGRRDDLTEATEDWLEKHGRPKCYQYQLQGDTLSQVAKRLREIGGEREDAP